jgi:hypothetical protein
MYSEMEDSDRKQVQQGKGRKVGKEAWKEE